MAKQPATIRKDPEVHASMDFSRLKRDSILHAQELSGDVWTDYNEHDPGVTIFEQLAYAMTELGFKTDIDVQRILFAKSDRGAPMAYDALYEADEIFSTSPFTALDYRKLLVDKLYPHVKNAWCIPKDISISGLNLKGLYKVLLLPEQDVDHEALIKRTRACLDAHRNLGEDFDSIQILTPLNVAIQTEIQIDQHAIGEAVLANVQYALARYLTPEPKFISLHDMQDNSIPIEEIYHGPLPEHGFLEDSSFHQSPHLKVSTILHSNLVRLIERVDGVLSVNNFTVLVDGKKNKSEKFQIGENYYPLLDLGKSTFQMFAGDVPYKADADSVSFIFKRISSSKETIPGSERVRRILPTLKSDLSRKEIANYESVQLTFPRLYGIGAYGLSERATELERARANQLKGYLLPFDQILANYLAQLVHFPRLFSLEDELPNTYFHQIPESIPRLRQLTGDNLDAFAQTLEHLVDRHDRHLIRRSRFLEHMLARFGESFLSQALSAIHQQAGYYNEHEFLKANISAKIQFLKEYVAISRDQARSLDVSQPSDRDNVASLKKRLSLIFNIERYEHRSLTVFSSSSFSSSRRKTAPKHKSGEFTFQAKDPHMLADTLLHGMKRENYTVDKKGNKFNVTFQNPRSDTGNIVFKGNTSEDCERALKELRTRLTQLNSDHEGFHMVEHILLRPIAVSKYRIYLSDGLRQLLLSEKVYEDKDKGADVFADEILNYGSKKTNYDITEDKDGFHGVLKGEKDTIAILDHFKVKATLEKAITQTMKFLKEHDKDTLLRNYIYPEELLRRAHTLPDDPYSMQLSFVLPDWTARFQNREFQQIFEEMAAIYAPAHLDLNFFWIPLQEMQSFEKTYFKWLDLKADQKAAPGEIDAYAFQLISLLLEFNSTQVAGQTS